MFRPTIALLVLGLGVGLALPARAGDSDQQRPGFSTVSGTGRTSWHAPQRRFWAPVSLASGQPRVTVVIQQVFLPPQVVSGLPTVLDLPVQLGIREAKPAQPAVYVLNDEHRAMRTGSIRVSAGPRIIDINTEAGEPAPGFGAKIIHLTVPAGGP